MTTPTPVLESKPGLSTWKANRPQDGDSGADVLGRNGRRPCASYGAGLCRPRSGVPRLQAPERAMAYRRDLSGRAADTRPRPARGRAARNRCAHPTERANATAANPKCLKAPHPPSKSPRFHVRTAHRAPVIAKCPLGRRWGTDSGSYHPGLDSYAIARTSKCCENCSRTLLLLRIESVR